MRGGLTRVEAGLLRLVRGLVAADPLLAGLERDGAALVVEAFGGEPWASLTFSGHRHRLGVAITGPADAVEGAIDRIELLADAEPPEFEGHVLIDLVVGECVMEHVADGHVRASVELEALSVEG